MKNLSKQERLIAAYTNLLEVRNCCLDLERNLFSIVVIARKCGLEPLFRKSLQGVLFCLRSSIALMNNELYSGRFRDIQSTTNACDCDDLPF